MTAAVATPTRAAALQARLDRLAAAPTHDARLASAMFPQRPASPMDRLIELRRELLAAQLAVAQAVVGIRADMAAHNQPTT